MNLYKFFQPLIFSIDSEKAHNVAVMCMKMLQNHSFFRLFIESMVKKHCVFDEILGQEICGLRFYNPLGLASGFDKNAELMGFLSAIGFGFLELGSVTKMPQRGNPKPRIFRHITEKSLQNALGFNNVGVQKMLLNLKDYSLKSAQHIPHFSGVLSDFYSQKTLCRPCFPRVPLGINIGKNKFVGQGNGSYGSKGSDKKNSDEIANYRSSLEILHNSGDYFVFNLSSPNTPGLRDLQNESFVRELLSEAKNITKKPLFIKISPDMLVDSSDSIHYKDSCVDLKRVDSMLRIVQSAIDSGASGIIATNTSVDYNLVNRPYIRDGAGFGGISGEALCVKSREILRILGQHFFGKTTLISVGGINNVDEVLTRLKLGASAVQILTGLVFEGPALVKNINEALAKRLKSEGAKHISEIIGNDV